MKNIYTILIICSYLYGWGNTGHRLVGEIAEDRLSNKAKREIKRPKAEGIVSVLNLNRLG